MSNYSTFVFGLHVDDAVEQAFRQFEELPDVFVIKKNKFHFIEKKILGITRRLHQSRNRKSDFVSRFICASDLHDAPLAVGSRYNFFFIESYQAINYGYVSSLKEKFPDSTFTLFLVNALKEYTSLKKWVENVEPLYDHIISCNQRDAKENHWIYRPDCYTPVKEIGVTSAVPLNDVVFLASDKGRADLAHEVYLYLSKMGLKCKFFILGKAKPEYEREGFSYISQAMSYEDYLRLVFDSRCILEIVANNEEFCTLRTMEAITYGKLLLTTNRSLSSEPFFDENSMYIFNKAEDIDIDFLKNDPKNMKVSADYFTPSNLLKFISEELERK
ncbi:hypothetical protein ACOI8T_09650 [Bifidobacterium breve]|uniref:hypothetical protein n=1 Tax=Bifidobacterium breve TaxID=1685 RepID=UPI003CFF86DA